MVSALDFSKKVKELLVQRLNLSSYVTSALSLTKCPKNPKIKNPKRPDPEKKITIWIEIFYSWNSLGSRECHNLRLFIKKWRVHERSWVVSIAMITHEETCVAFRQRGRNVDDSSVHIYIYIIAQLRGLMRGPWCGALFGGQGRSVSLSGHWVFGTRITELIIWSKR